MKKALDYAKYFLHKNLDSCPNTFDGNMKLQKLLVFADCISIANDNVELFEDQILAFKNGCVVEAVRQEYKHNYLQLAQSSRNYEGNFSSKEQEVLDLTEKIFGGLSAVELSDLNHQFDFWKKAYEQGCVDGDYHDKAASVVSVDDIRAESGKIKQVIAAFNRSQDIRQREEIVNGKTFYYDPEQIILTDEMMDQIEEFSLVAEDKSYSLCLDGGRLVIF